MVSEMQEASHARAHHRAGPLRLPTMDPLKCHAIASLLLWGRNRDHTAVHSTEPYGYPPRGTTRGPEIRHDDCRYAYRVGRLGHGVFAPLGARSYFRPKTRTRVRACAPSEMIHHRVRSMIARNVGSHLYRKLSAGVRHVYDP